MQLNFLLKNNKKSIELDTLHYNVVEDHNFL